MRYRLRTLLIVLALGPPLLAGARWGWLEWQERRAVEAERQFSWIQTDKGWVKVEWEVKSIDFGD
jgi:hypothetical protein